MATWIDPVCLDEIRADLNRAPLLSEPSHAPRRRLILGARIERLRTRLAKRIAPWMHERWEC